MSNKLFAGLLLLATFFLLGCAQELTDEQIEERNAKSRATIAERAYKMRRGDTDIKSGGNWIAKRIGGNAHITLPPKHKLVTLTWKQDDMWILYRPFREGEQAEYYIYKEDSKFGLVEGTVIIKECE